MLAARREIEAVAPAAFGGELLPGAEIGDTLALRIGGRMEIFHLGHPFWARLVEMARRIGPAPLAEPGPGRHRVRVNVRRTGTRRAAGKAHAPRPNTPGAVLVADLPPPDTPEIPATAEPARA